MLIAKRIQLFIFTKGKMILFSLTSTNFFGSYYFSIYGFFFHSVSNVVFMHILQLGLLGHVWFGREEGEGGGENEFLCCSNFLSFHFLKWGVHGQFRQIKT